MGDRVTIPRSFADSLGVADVQNSLRRHYINFPLNRATTTGTIWGGGETTAMSIIRRNSTFERIITTAFCSTSFGGGSTLGQVRLFDGATTVFDCPIFAGTTGSAMWAIGSTSPSNADIGSGANLRLTLVNTVGRVLRLSVSASFRDALDS